MNSVICVEVMLLYVMCYFVLVVSLYSGFHVKLVLY